MLSDFDDLTRNTTSRSSRSFAPRFDVREGNDGYQLDGELPGIDQKDITIEFTDPHTLVVKGRSAQESSSGTPPQGFVEDVPASKGAVEGKHQATVEDAEGEQSSPALTPEKVASTEVTKPASQPQKPEHKYWVSERSVGEFHRSFSFPSRVDQDAVKASLKNGILSIVVPKLKETQHRKIDIE